MPRIAVLLYLAPVAPVAMALQALPTTQPASEISMYGELAKTGIVGVFAAVMLWLYRTDRKESEARLAQMAEDHKDAMSKIADDYKEAMERMFEAISYFRTKD